MADTLIALGANLGDKSGAIDEAVAHLAGRPGVELIAVSQTIGTRPIGVPDSDEMFLNAAARFQVDVPVDQWLQTLMDAERALGRRRSVRWGARHIDLDLLLYESVVVRSDPLHVPHPRMGFRRFVMEPAVQIASDMWHPVCRCSLGRLWTYLNETPNWIYWSCSSADQLRLAGELTFDVPVETWVTGADEPVGKDDLLRLSGWLDQWSVSGEHAGAVLVCQLTSDSGKTLELLGTVPKGFPKLCIRQFGTPSWHDVQGDDDGHVVRLELELEQSQPQRVQQEVVGAIESLLTL